eukprot:TRINITY_DN1228_c0_g1_i2.p1 TRINITY_DN1228_c0_g1~~TRINITY_DN1228_c0_g1_i2.p1  ORF type:complete len:380 (+),score=74.75 TRINITY_DN1228_c0_g1_i2:1202-2341(+)
MTNKKDLIDEALLRPGRFEVKMEIGLPDLSGRIQIFNIHTTSMRKNGYMDTQVDIKELALLSKNYSGAEIEGVVRSAASFALNRQIDVKSITHPDPTKIRVMKDDFTRALGEVRPAFGVTEEKLRDCIKNGIIPYSEAFSQVLNSGMLFIKQVEASNKTPLLSLILHGKNGSGKSALAAQLALSSQFPFIKLLSPEDFLGYVESTRVEKIHRAFRDAHKSELSVIVVDDIERVIEYAPIGPRFSNTVLQALLILFKTHPPKDKKLLVIGTTSNMPLLRQLGFLSSVDYLLEIPSITSGREVCTVLKQLRIPCTKEDFETISSQWEGSTEIKKLINLVEMTTQAIDPKIDYFGEKLVELHKAGLIIGSEPKGKEVSWNEI